jgi:hypothetical protein
VLSLPVGIDIGAAEIYVAVPAHGVVFFRRRKGAKKA